jgi:hypothetical protein
MPFKYQTNNKILPANARAADVAEKAIQEIIPVQQRRLKKIKDASRAQLIKWSTKYFPDISINSKNTRYMQELLVKRFCPNLIPSCHWCGKTAVQWIGVTRTGPNLKFPTGFAAYCFHHSKKEKTIATNRYIYGYDWANYHPDIKAKEEATCLKNNGVRKPFQSKDVQDKVKNTQIIKYGGNPAKDEKVKEKIKNSWIKNMGMVPKEFFQQEHIKAKRNKKLASIETKQKRLETNQERFGVDNVMQSDIVKEAFCNTMIDKYGVNYAQQSKQIVETKRANYYAEHGVHHHFQRPEIFEKFLDSVYDKEKYITTNGDRIGLQGYEPQVALALEDRGWFIRKPKQSIPYKFKKEKKIYHPDFVIERGDKRYLVEVKSSYTLLAKNSYKKNKAKFLAAENITVDRFILAVALKSEIILIVNPGYLNRKDYKKILKGDISYKNVRRISHAV